MEKLIVRVTELMQELTNTYQKLANICENLATAFVKGQTESVELLTRSGQGELLQVRAKLSQITNLLTTFTHQQANRKDSNSLNAQEKNNFELASKALIVAAKNFRQICQKTAPLAINGIAFANVCFDIYGIESTTYHEPYSIRRNKT